MDLPFYKIYVKYSAINFYLLAISMNLLIYLLLKKLMFLEIKANCN